jgi:hypothetical protein
MLKFTGQKFQNPNEGWVYTHPGTGFVITAPSWNDLMVRIRTYRLANGIPLGVNFEETIGSELCEQHGWGGPTCTHGEPTPPQMRSIGLHDIVGFLKILRSWLFSNPTFVSQEEANSRAKICTTCPYNVEATGCFGCTNIVGLIFDVIGDRKTESDIHLKNCQVCGCVNKAQVWVPKDTLDQGLSPEMREELPEWCWKK